MVIDKTDDAVIVFYGYGHTKHTKTVNIQGKEIKVHTSVKIKPSVCLKTSTE